MKCRLMKEVRPEGETQIAGKYKVKEEVGLDH